MIARSARGRRVWNCSVHCWTSSNSLWKRSIPHKVCCHPRHLGFFRRNSGLYSYNSRKELNHLGNAEKMVTNLTEVDQDSLVSFVSSAAPGTQVSVQVPTSDNAVDVEVRLTLAGFINIKESSPSTFTARLPAYMQGTSVALSEKPKAANSNAWAAALSSNEQVPLVDENELLKRDGIPDGDGKGCAVDSTGKRKPCKDCSCGLADVYEEQQQSDTAPKSSCGNCSLGDAFRCASCPYLGLPPFKPGEKVAIPSSFMTSDI